MNKMTQDKSSNLPVHVGIILDGNRRWARENNLPTLEGHRNGYSNLKDIAKYAINNGVEYVSAYIFSTENWKRTKEEVKYLLDLALWVATTEVREVHKEDIRVKFLGSNEGLSDKLIQAIENAEELTKNNQKGTLALCFNYGGQQEIVDAVNKLIDSDKKPASIGLEELNSAVYAPEIPPIDLIIRTSGEQRLSNFMLWRAAYAELYFVKKHWPDFGLADFDDAMKEFQNRKRRFGN